MKKQNTSLWVMLENTRFENTPEKGFYCLCKKIPCTVIVQHLGYF